MRHVLLLLALALVGCNQMTRPVVQRSGAAPTPVVIIKEEPRGPVTKPRAYTPDDRPILTGPGGAQYRLWHAYPGQPVVREYIDEQ